jgi:hypothetical protein
MAQPSSRCSKWTFAVVWMRSRPSQSDPLDWFWRVAGYASYRCLAIDFRPLGRAQERVGCGPFNGSNVTAEIVRYRRCAGQGEGRKFMNKRSHFPPRKSPIASGLSKMSSLVKALFPRPSGWGGPLPYSWNALPNLTEKSEFSAFGASAPGRAEPPAPSAVHVPDAPMPGPALGGAEALVKGEDARLSTSGKACSI